MSSQDDEKALRFLDSAPNISKNPEFINFLNNERENPISGSKLDKTDYVAIFIALMETVFFPLILLIAVLIAVSLFFSHVF